MSTPTAYHHLRARLHLALGLNAVIIVGEFAGGWLLNSMGLMSDAGHNLVDQGSLFLALYAHLLTSRPATESRTFGYHRAGMIAAFLNSFILLVTACGILLIGLKRLFEPVVVDGAWMMGIAAVSFAANLGIALLLQQGAKDDLNIRSAFWHMLADAWVSFGVIVSGGAILLTGWTVLDPLMSIFVVAAIVHGAWPIFKESLEVLLESTPPGINASSVAATIESIQGVVNVHDLHIWAIEPRLIMLTCHILIEGEDTADTTSLLKTIRDRITGDFGIKHMTIQLETSCAHPNAMHCNLNTLAGHHPSVASVHVIH
ncbi:MAG: cation diffusion facilitator family transporter [Nitrospira sp.]|nr:cation diffusion facilitator family transporter [Nitrospira sp.]